MGNSKIKLRATSRDAEFSVTIRTQDLPLPSSRTASLMWLKLLLGKDLLPRSEVSLSCIFMTMNEIQVSALFLQTPTTPTKRVTLEEAAALQLRINYAIEDEAYMIILQVPKLLESPLKLKLTSNSWTPCNTLLS